MRWLGWLLLVFCSAWAHSDEPALLTRIGAQMEPYAVVRAEFTQTRQMAALKRPLVTRGQLVYSRRDGVLWQIEQPVKTSYVLGEDRIVEISGDGVRRERAARDVPGLAQVGRVFRAMLGANTVALREYFDASARGDLTHWEIDLKPRQAALSQFMAGMHLAGGHFVESIRMEETGGDSTLIQLRHSQVANAPSAAELLLFGGDAAARTGAPVRP